MLIYSRLSWTRSYATKAIKFDGNYKMVLAKTMFEEGHKALAAKTNATDLRKGIEMAVGAVSKYLSSRARMINSYEEIAQVGTTSANGDREIGDLISKALEIAGKNGPILVFDGTDGKTHSTELEFYSGMKLNGGYISPWFINDLKGKKCVLEHTQILIYEKRLTLSEFDLLMDALKEDFNFVMDLLRNGSSLPLLIVAEDIETDVLGTLIINKCMGIKVCAIKAPRFWKDRTACLHELSSCTGGRRVTDMNHINNKHPSIFKQRPRVSDIFGRCLKVIISENDTMILTERLSMEDIGVASFKQLGSTPESIPDEDWLFTVIKVGGASKKGVGKKKNMVTRALNAARAAMEEGFVPGGGITFLYASKELDKLHTANSGQEIGVRIIQNALKMPLYKIAKTVGVEGSIVVGKLLEQDNPDLGYDAAKGEYIDMIQSGILDPLKVVRAAFLEAARRGINTLQNIDEA